MRRRRCHAPGYCGRQRCRRSALYSGLRSGEIANIGSYHRGNKISAIFNVESYFLATFKATQEREFVEACARILSRCLARTDATDMVHV